MLPIQFVKDSADFDNYLKSNKYIVANFTASWCGPCQALKPIVDKLHEDPNYSDVEIVRVDLDANGDIAQRYQISSVPTFVFFENSKEIDRVTGFSPPQFLAALGKLALKAKSDPQASKTAQYSIISEIASFVPKGYVVLNDVIHFGEMVSLNSIPLEKSPELDAKYVFRTASETKLTIITDADSQGLFFVPLNNICKLYSVLVKFAKPEHSENSELDADELENEIQSPSTVKIWPNKPSILSFDDAAGDSSAPHVENIDGNFSGGWYEVKVKYVRFQNVQNLNIFIDGADEDFHTLVERIVLVGVTGDSKDQGPLQTGEEE